ncbi:MAG: InlB B-repeat-containing protein [Coriobacteriia bacterium]|nr:InlB B-repeat-containing protein [Coriobacteriia bacterium]
MDTKKKVGIGIAAAVVIVLVAAFLWFTHPYKITYDLNGGEPGATANPESYTISDTVTLTEPVRAGYVFAGWQGTDVPEPTKEVTIAQGSTGDREYKAIWHQLVDLKVSKITISHGDSTVTKASQTVNLMLWGVGSDEEWEPVGQATYNAKGKLAEMKYDKAKNVTTFTLRKGKNTFKKVEDKYTEFMVTAENAEAGFEVDPAEGVHIDADCSAEFNMKFNPETWTMKFTVKAADQYTAKLVQDSGMRVMCWNAWKDGMPYNPINQHKIAYLTVKPTVEGNIGKALLWKWDAESTHSYPPAYQTDPQTYYFSVDMHGYKLSTGQKFLAGKDAPIEATVTVKDGMPDCGGRTAVYLRQEGKKAHQAGKLTVTLKAKTYGVELHTNGGKIAKDHEVTAYRYGTSVQLPELKHMTRDGYDFAGWYTKDGSKDGKWGDLVTEISRTSIGEVDLYARWTEQPNVVTFHPGKGNKAFQVEVAHGDTMKAPKEPKADGYEFDGWYEDELCTIEYDFEKTKVTEDFDLYAGWIGSGVEAPATGKAEKGVS